MRTLHPKCYRDCEPSGRNAINACWRAPGKEAQPLAQNETTSTNPSNEMQEKMSSKRSQMQPFSRKSSRNENPLIEKKLWVYRAPASPGTLGTPWSPALELFSLLIINLPRSSPINACLPLTVHTSVRAFYHETNCLRAFRRIAPIGASNRRRALNRGRV